MNRLRHGGRSSAFAGRGSFSRRGAAHPQLPASRLAAITGASRSGLGPRSPTSWLSSASNVSSNDTLTTALFRRCRRSRLAPSPPAAHALLGLVGDGRQADLALVVDLVDAHFQLLPEGEHVLDGVDPLAATELGDVDQAVPARILTKAPNFVMLTTTLVHGVQLGRADRRSPGWRPLPPPRGSRQHRSSRCPAHRRRRRRCQRRSPTGSC